MSGENYHFSINAKDSSAFAQLIRMMHRIEKLSSDRSWDQTHAARALPEQYGQRALRRIVTPERSDRPIEPPDILLNQILERASKELTREGHNVSAQTLAAYALELESIRSAICGVAAQIAITTGQRARALQQEADQHFTKSRVELI